MAHHERMFRHEHAYKLDDPDREKWPPNAVVVQQIGLRLGVTVADIRALARVDSKPLPAPSSP